jgi:hypothetical protein
MGAVEGKGSDGCLEALSGPRALFLNGGPGSEALGS